MPKLSETTITKSVIDRSKPESSTFEIRDAELRGFILRVYPTGRKVFVVQLERNQRRKVGDASLLTITAARRKALAMQVKHHSGEAVDSQRNVTPTLKDFLDGKYLGEIRRVHKQPEVSVARINGATKSLADIKLHRLNEFDIQKWKKTRMDGGLKKATFNRDLATLKRALSIAVELRLISNNPALNVKRFGHADHRRERYLTPDERESLFTALRDRDTEIRRKRESGNRWREERAKPLYPTIGTFADYLEPLVILVLNTGMRRSEALSLTWEDVRLAHDPQLTVHWTVAKSQKTRHIPLNEKAVDALRKWQNQTVSTGLVFTYHGKQMSEVKNSWKSLMECAGIKDFRFHDLRHDFASQLVTAGNDLYRVKNLLGHASISTTERYAHLSNQALREAVATLDQIR